MLRNILLPFILFTGLVAPAAPFTPTPDQVSSTEQSWEPIDFYRREEAIKRWKLPAKYLNAHVKIQVVRLGFNDNCSGSVISNDGHILTAAHCFDECFSENGYRSQSGIVETMEKTLKRYSPLGRQAQCQVRINYGRSVTAEILVTSPCAADTIQTVIAAHAKNIPVPVEFASCDQFGDIAIIKVPQETSASLLCAPLATTLPQVGERVAMLSYPIATNRDVKGADAVDADGISQYFTFGQIVQQDFCTKPNGSNGRLHDHDQAMRPVRIQTTVDGIGGTSGAGLFNSHGYIVGVKERGLNSTTSECRGSSFHSPISLLKPNQAAWNPSFDLSQIKCDRKSVLR